MRFAFLRSWIEEAASHGRGDAFGKLLARTMAQYVDV